MDSPRKGDVWLVNFDPTCGKEIQKKRPAVVVSRDEYNAFAWPVLVVPMTSQGLDKVAPVFEVVVPQGEGGTDHDSKTKANHMRTVDRERLVELLGHVGDPTMHAIEQTIRNLIDMT
jgi:mRNA interferase MazF